MRHLTCLAWIWIVFSVSAVTCAAKDFEAPSSFNPVGSGARAVGMGGAFIAVADDATAASWNPGGLIQLKRPEMSLVSSYLHRKEKNRFDSNPEGDATHQVSEADINYLSAAYPFEFLDRNMIVSLSFQRLFDFDRDWDFYLNRKGASSAYTDHWDFRQDGALSALGLSYCAQVLPRRLSVGFTFNVWDDDLTENSWKQVYKIKRTLTSPGTPYMLDYFKTRDYSLKGFNANVGLLWNVSEKLTVGAVLKTPFTADIDYRERETLTDVHPTYPSANRQRIHGIAGKSELKMPMSYGLGVRWDFSQSFMLAFDIYRTEWDDFTFENAEGEKISPITGLSMDETDTKPTVQARLGAEYLFTDKYKGIAIPLRCGVFYDPAPARGSPDDFFGFSLGAGFTKNERFSFDVAYQFRFGDNVGASLFPFESFSQDVREHKVYASIIVYWPGNFRKKPFGI